MENGIFNRRNVISICVVAAVIVILTIVFLSRSNTGDEHIDDIQKDRVKYEDMQNKVKEPFSQENELCPD